jgi:sterol desaturase/sphingolipid hydroxylase (fatty acid hydroxylase superfamily)
MYFYFLKADPLRTSKVHFWDQTKVILLNFLQLPILQLVWDYLEQEGYTKATMGNFDLFSIIRDCCLWMLCFEWAWYFQHRGMHDNKFLWRLGHSYHHTWNSPEHMIGITNFAFDHIVEFWVTMSSSFLGYIIFPSNFFVGKAISLFYMVLAVLAHWEGYQASRYHINHHYLVTKNYGSHIPIFDILFGTFQWDTFVHSKSIPYTT